MLKTCWIALFLSVPFSLTQTPEPQKPAEAQPPSTTTFKSQTDLVLLPVVVRGQHGKYVTGLGKDLFHVKENGKEQVITLFEEVHAANDNPPPPLALDGGYSNIPFDTTSQIRPTILVLDLLNTTLLQRSDGKEQLAKFLSKGLARNQPVSLLCLTIKGVQLVSPLTTDANAVIKALKSVPIGAETITSRRDVAETTLRQLRDIARSYSGITGRKIMILAAGNIPELKTERTLLPSSLLADDIRQMWKSILDANISVYPFEIMDWSRNPALGGRSNRRVDITLRQFSDSTGGNLCVESNDLMGCLADAEEDSRSYYMLGFSVQPDDRKPGWRDLDVKVSVEHASVHARDGFYYGAPLPDDSQSVHEAEVNALASPLAYSGVPMYVKALPSPPAAPVDPAAASSGNSGKKTIEFLVIIPISGIKIDPTKSNSLDVDVGAIALTRDMREAAEFSHPVRGNPKPDEVQKLSQEGIRLREKLELPPGFYSIRFFARDNDTGQIGTIVFPLEVKD